MVGTFRKSKFPNASQRPALQAGLSEDGDLRPAKLSLFCTETFMGEVRYEQGHDLGKRREKGRVFQVFTKYSQNQTSLQKSENLKLKKGHKSHLVI